MNPSLLGYPPGGATGEFSTGDVKLTFKTSADVGWVMMNDGSIGNSTSGATTRANRDTWPLYNVLWTNIADAWAPVSGGRGASALADFAAGKTLTLPKALGRALAVSGAGATLTSRALGENLGAEAHTLTQPQLPNVTLSVSASGSMSGTGTIRANAMDGVSGGPRKLISGTDTTAGTDLDTANHHAISVSGSVSGSTSALGSGQSHPIMQPTSFFNVMVKL